MRTNCFEIDEKGRARKVEFGDSIEQPHAGAGVIWIDVESPTREESNDLLAKLGLDAEHIDEILELGHAARTIPFDGGLFFEHPIEIAGQPAELKSTAFVCLDRMLVTIRREAQDAASRVTVGEILHLDFGDGTAPSIVSTLLVELSLRLRGRSLEGRRALTELADRLDEDPDSVSARRISNLKRQLFDLDAISEERSATLESLRSAGRFFLSSVDATDRLSLALENTAATTRRLDRLDRRAEVLQARLDAIAHEKTNRRLSRLTIISAIFLPLTLIAGIYGMNFEVMPELGFPYAYPLTLVGMVAVAVGLLWWFRRGGWMV